MSLPSQVAVGRDIVGEASSLEGKHAALPYVRGLGSVAIFWELNSTGARIASEQALPLQQPMKPNGL